MAATFTQPWALLALPLAAIPLILYLVRRWRLRRVRWAAMDFLFASAQQKARRTRLRDLILLALRTAIILAAVLAVSRPTWRAAAIPLGAQPRALAVVVDNSCSMSYASEGSTPLERAKAAARELIRSLRTGETATLSVCAFPAEAVIREPTHDRRALELALEQVPPTERSTDIAGGLRSAAQSLAGALGQRRQIHLLTDLQKSGWQSVGPGDLQPGGAEHPPPAILLHDLSVPSASNLAITELRLIDAVAASGSPAQMECIVRNFSGERRTDVPLSFFVDGHPRDARKIDLEPAAEERVIFSARFDDESEHFAQLVVGSDPLPADNRRWLTLRPRRSIPILLLDGTATSAAEPMDAFFLKLALRPESPPAETISLFEPTVLPAENLPPEAIAKAAAVVLANVPALDDASLAALEAAVRKGAGLLVFLGDRIVPAFYNERLYRSGRGLLPAALGTLVERRDGETLDLSGFAAFKAGVTLPSTALVHRRYALEAGDGDEQRRQVLGEVPGGGPLIVAQRFGRGLVVLVATTANDAWNSWPKTGIYLPLVHEILGKLLADEDQHRALTVGEALRIELPGELFRQSVTFRVPDSVESRTVPVLPDGDRFAAVFTDTAKSGLYHVELPSAAAEPRTLICCVNIDPRESDLAKLSLPEVQQLTGAKELALADAPPMRGGPAGGAERFEGGRLALYLVCLLLFAELAATQIR